MDVCTAAMTLGIIVTNGSIMAAVDIRLVVLRDYGDAIPENRKK